MANSNTAAVRAALVAVARAAVARAAAARAAAAADAAAWLAKEATNMDAFMESMGW
jgi:hypothetical protein